VPGWLRRDWQLLVLAGWTALWFVLLAPGQQRSYPEGGGIAWRPFLAAGSRLLFAGLAADNHHQLAGLRLYAQHPNLQIGPFAFAVAEPIRFLSPHSGLVAAQVILSVMGLAVLGVIRQIVIAVRPDVADRTSGWPFLVGGAVFVVGWQELAVAYAHLDDGLVLLCSVLATWAAVRGRPVLTGILLGLAVDAKPWALVFLPVLLLAGGLSAWRSPTLAGRPPRASFRPAAQAAVAAAVVIAAGWVPFFLADPATMAAFHFKIVNEPASALRALGVTSAKTPSWDRAAQAAVGCVLGALALWRRRWPAVILLGVGARIALDPAVHGYYTAGLLAGALLWDLLGSRWRLPVWTIVSYAALDLMPLVIRDAAALGVVRLGLVIAFTTVILLGPDRLCWPFAGNLPGTEKSNGRARLSEFA
jgi:hypothetical protein